MWTSRLLGRYVPIAWMTLGLDYLIWGMQPTGYHLTNILFHSANAVILYFVAVALYQIAQAKRGALSDLRLAFSGVAAELLFSVHPLRTESVAWVTERRDVVSGFFYLLSVLAYLRAFASADR